ncbi:T9SS type A sorting domain-containing protein [Flavobacterium sp. 3HN19-14]|uniref:T9SS type A sorting domain-containing protein n=1 Tax=Flavobacterium sp. 3HN19-14 TaxID=3448133 RepID=UPI003EDF1BD0
MKKISSLMILFAFNCFGQAPIIEWQKSYGGTLGEGALCIKHTPDGGYIIGGSSRSNDGDVTQNQGSTDAWIVKLNTAGNIQWQKTYGGTGNDAAYKIELSNDGGYIFLGMTNSADGNISGFHGNDDLWAVKLDTAGNIQWQKALGGSGYEFSGSIIAVVDGYVICGSSNSNDGDLNFNNGNTDGWVVKLNFEGDILWQKSYGNDDGNDDGEGFYGISQTSDGGYLVCGDKGMSNWWTRRRSRFIRRMGGENRCRRQFRMAEFIRNEPTEQLIFGGSGTSDGGIIFCGYTSVYDDNGNVTDDDMYVAKVDFTGNLVWQKSYGGSSDEVAYAVSENPDGTFTVIGETGSSDGDATQNYGSSDAWVLKLDTSGNIVWQKNYGGTEYEYADSFVNNNDGSITFAGTSSSTDHDLSENHGNSDLWITKLEGTLSTVNLKNNNLSIFPNPAKDVIYYNFTENETVINSTVSDMCGKICLQNANKRNINVAALQSGIYIINVATTKGTYKTKFIKQ